MFHVVLLTALALGRHDLGPTLPPGLNKQFTSAVLSVEKSLSASDFSTARNLVALLPKRNVVIEWDDSKVAAKDRAAFIVQRDNVCNDWKSAAKINLTIGSSRPDIVFTFAPTLPKNPVMDLPPGIAYAWSDDLKQPRLTCALNLTKGHPPIDVSAGDLHNAILQAIGIYYGLGSSHIPGTMMGETEFSFPDAFEITDPDASTVREVIQISDELRADVQERKSISPTMPKASFDTQAIEMGEHLQGEPAPFKLKIANTGNSTLALRFAPDCGCVVTQRTATVDAGGTFVLDGSYDTAVRFGDIQHDLEVTTNDPDNPSLSIPIHVVVRPKYRLIIPKSNAIKMGESTADVTAYLLTLPDSPVSISDAVVVGAKSTATIEKWSGSLADPAIGETEKPRTGFKIVVHLTNIPKNLGNIPMTLAVSTSDPQFKTLSAPFFEQQGIAASPSQLYIGQLSSDQRNFSVFLTGPGENFHIKHVSCDWPHLSLQVFTFKEGLEYRVQAIYDGKAPKGEVHATLSIETDNEQQPVIRVPVTGMVN